MFTVCPKCALTLVVTAADLRVAQGYVRCGRCSSVFNALARLTDERQAAAAGEPDPAPAAELAEPTEPAELAEPAAPAEAAQSPTTRAPAGEMADSAADAGEGEVISEAALEFNPAGVDVTALFVEPAPDPQWTAATGSFKAMIAANPEGAAGEPAAAEAPPPPPPAAEPLAEPAATTPAEEPLVVEVDAAFLARLLGGAGADDPAGIVPAAATAGASPAPRAPPTREPDDPRTAKLARPRPPRPASPHPRPAQVATAETPPAARMASAAPPAPATPPPPAAARAPEMLPDAREGSGDADDAVTQETVVRSARWLPHAWVAGAVLAVLLLLGQIVNHYREQLAADGRFNRPLTRLYAAFGVKLTPAWDLRAYDVRQLGASVDPASHGLITVRASVKNGARQPQPLPLLRVTLEDRFGNRLASRDVAPRFYLPAAVPTSSFLASGQRVDAQMGFLDPGANAVGFEIDACLPANGGVVTCANDVNAR